MNPQAKTEGGGPMPGLDHEPLKAAIRGSLERVFADPDQIPLFFTDDYEQTTDGTRCDRREFEEHIRHLVSVAQSIQFEVLDALQQAEQIADRHLVHIAYKDGRKATIEVYLFGTTVGGRFRRVHEVTRIVSGDQTLKDAPTARSGG